MGESEGAKSSRAWMHADSPVVAQRRSQGRAVQQESPPGPRGRQLGPRGHAASGSPDGVVGVRTPTSQAVPATFFDCRLARSAGRSPFGLDSLQVDRAPSGDTLLLGL